MRPTCFVVFAVSLWASAGCSDAARSIPDEDGGAVDGGPSPDGALPDGGSSGRDSGFPPDRTVGEDGGGADAGGAVFGSCEMAPVDVQETCPDVGSCGGHLPGTSWCYTRSCYENHQVFGAITSFCPDAVLMSSSGTVTGRVEFALSGRFTQHVATHVEGSLIIVSSCLSGVDSCEAVEEVVTPMLPSETTATCAREGAGPCICDVMLDQRLDVDTTYATSGHTFILEERRFDYCKGADGLAFQESGVDDSVPRQLEPNG